MTTPPTTTALGLDTALRAGLRWLYATEQPAQAVVERRGAKIIAVGRKLRFVPISVGGTPLIVVDLLDVHWGISGSSPPLNVLPPDELPCLAEELGALGIPAGQQHYHGVTGTIVLDTPAHPSLLEAVGRYDRGCPYHHSLVCDAPVRDGGQSCSWRAAGRRAAIWPDPIADHGHAR